MILLNLTLYGTITEIFEYTTTHMLNIKTVNDAEIGNFSNTQTVQFNKKFKKAQNELGTWFRLPTTILGAFLATRYGGVTTIGTAAILQGLVLILIPTCAQYSFNSVLAAEGLFGVFENMMYTGYSETCSQWIPIKERTAVIPTLSIGIYIGSILFHSAYGLLNCISSPTILYFSGALYIIGSAVWLNNIKNSPSRDKKVCKLELEYILQGTAVKKYENPNNTTLPSLLCYFLTMGKHTMVSPSCWAALIGIFGVNWILTILSIFIKAQKSTEEMGQFAFTTHISIFIPAVGFLVNYWQNHSTLTVTQIDKAIISGGYLLAALLFAVSALSGDFTGSIPCFFVIKLLLSCNKIFLEVIIVNMAPNHSGLLSGLALFWQTNGIIVAQTIVGYVVKNHRLQEWNVCFHLSACISLITAIVFVMFGSSEPQRWSVLSVSENDGEMNQKNENPIK